MIQYNTNGKPQDFVIGGLTKRIIDFLIATTVSIVNLPLYVLIAILVKLTSRGPIFYKAKRVGFQGDVFEIIKFRSMCKNADKMGAAVTEGNDPRVTKIGQHLRASKLDELPQMLNVFRGEMSIVGPRPEDEETMMKYYPKTVRQELLQARPGITGLLQIRVYPDMTNELVPNGMDPFEFYLHDQLPRRAAVDIEYVRSWSLMLDFKIILNTIWCLFIRAPKMLLFGRGRKQYVLPPITDSKLRNLFDEHFRVFKVMGKVQRRHNGQY
jgi:lipopolysaccharide/colanic/teichoic acid biosynthesis glycosyltransferase